MSRKRKTAASIPSVPRELDRTGDDRWPHPTPLPTIPPEDVGVILRRILDRLDSIEKRLQNIERMLMTRG